MKTINHSRKKSKKTFEDGRIPCSWIAGLNIVKVAILLKTTYQFNLIPIKIPMPFFTEIEKLVLQFLWKHKRPHTSKAEMNKNSNTEGIIIPNFKLYYRAIVVKTAWY
jgi:hypothetical protein